MSKDKNMQEVKPESESPATSPAKKAGHFRLKKFLIIFAVVLSVLIVLVLVAAGILASKVIDKTDPTPEDIREAGLTLEDVIQRTAVEALSVEGEDEDIAVKMDSREVNELLFGLLPSLKVKGLSFKGAYFTGDTDGKYQVEIPVLLGGILPTTIKGKVVFRQDEDSYSIQILNASAGKLQLNSFWISLFLGNGKSIQKALVKAGIQGKLDVRKVSFTITSDQIVGTVSGLIPTEPTRQLVTVLTDMAVHTPEMLSIHFGSQGYFGFTLHMDTVAYDEERDGELAYPYDVDAVQVKVEKDIREGIAINPDNISSVYNYYVQGYDALNDNAREQVDALGYSPLERGARSTDLMDMEDLILEYEPTTGITQLILHQSFTLSLSETELNMVLANLPFLGTNIAFVYGGKTATILIECLQFYQIRDNEMELLMAVNLNGHRVALRLSALSYESTSEHIEATVQKLNFGDAVLTPYVKGLLEYLSMVLEEENWISASGENQSITLDLTQLLSDNLIFALIRSQAKSLTMSFVGSADQTGGHLYLNYRFM